jgi:hypothetical protein
MMRREKFIFKGLIKLGNATLMSKSNLSIDRRKQKQQRKLKLMKNEFEEELNQIKKVGPNYDEDKARQ